MSVYSNTRMNLSHYAMGFIHYFGSVTAILAESPGFIDDRGWYWLQILNTLYQNHRFECYFMFFPPTVNCGGWCCIVFILKNYVPVLVPLVNLVFYFTLSPNSV
jgi:hypothetical protein